MSANYGGLTRSEDGTVGRWQDTDGDDMSAADDMAVDSTEIHVYLFRCHFILLPALEMGPCKIYQRLSEAQSPSRECPRAERFKGRFVFVRHYSFVLASNFIFASNGIVRTDAPEWRGAEVVRPS